MSKQTDDLVPSPGTTLYIDIGNTSVKAAYRSGAHWNVPDDRGLNNAESLVEWINRHAQQFELIVISSVLPGNTEALVDNLQTDRYRILTINDIPEDLIYYKTPETLGVDRFFTCYGAVASVGEAVVVVDAGTACTVDFMSTEFVYGGGVIMPGIAIVEDALRRHTPRLPQVKRTVPGDWPGSSTEESLQWGLTGFYKESLNVYLSKYEHTFGSFELVITGGDAEWISTLVERDSKVRTMLIFDGIRRYLEDYL